MNNTETEQTVHLAEYYYILNKHKWTIIASLVVIVTLTMLFTFLMRPVYRASTTMVIEKEQTTSPVTGERLDYESYLSQSLTFNTHFKLITSRVVMENVIKELKLDQPDADENIEVSPWRALLTQFKKNVRLLMGREEKILSPEEKLAQLADKLKKKIDIQEIRDTRLLNVSVEDHDPVMVRDIANAVVKIYIEFNITNRLKYSQNTLSWMSDQLYEVKKILEDSEQAFLAYKQEQKLFSVEGKQKVIAQKIADFNDSYLEARNKRLTLDAKLAELRRSFQEKGDTLHARSLINNTLIDNLYSQLLDLDVELSRLSKVYRPKHPKVVQIKTKIENTSKKLKQEIGKEMESMAAERAVLLSREKVLQKTILDFENDALNTNKKELKYTIFQRNVETNQKLYDTLLSKVKEANITGNIDASNLRVTHPEHHIWTDDRRGSRFPVGIHGQVVENR
ncbi:MAG: GumC family protein [Deltaproteobacteria bacterium]|nr:GumC family protein [Deltaproteobacteria bacterium]